MCVYPISFVHRSINFQNIGRGQRIWCLFSCQFPSINSEFESWGTMNPLFSDSTTMYLGVFHAVIKTIELTIFSCKLIWCTIHYNYKGLSAQKWYVLIYMCAIKFRPYYLYSYKCSSYRNLLSVPDLRQWKWKTDNTTTIRMGKGQNKGVRGSRAELPNRGNSP